LNTYGDLFRLTTFGESHGKAMGFILDGLPSGVTYDEAVLLDLLARRRPGGAYVSGRKEQDSPELLSGFYEGKSLGTPVACIFKNTNQKSEDYKDLKPRRGHADLAWKSKYGHSDPRGGGRSSGRETLSRVGAAAFAKMFFTQNYPELKVLVSTHSIGPIKDGDSKGSTKLLELGFLNTDSNEEAKALLKKAKAEGESYGGTISVQIVNPIKNLGEPVFKKTKSKLAEAVLSIGAVKSFSLGTDVDLSTCKGTEFHSMNEEVYGGLSGGITNGQKISFYADVKPTSSILDVAKKGRHDPCIVPRALAVVEAMVYLVLMDLYLSNKVYKN